MSSINNILSYFIKDIKDPIEQAFYRQQNYNDYIIILYKNEYLFEINSFSIFNYILNIYKSRIINNIKRNYKIQSYGYEKYLYYKHDKTLKTINYNFISFYYICKKYLVKTYFRYFIYSIIEFIMKVKYSNGYKYMYNKYINNKYTKNIILIMNKYELNYYNKFFNIYLLVNKSKNDYLFINYLSFNEFH